MKILVFSDLHGDQALIDKVREESKKVDIAICCGDITPVHGDTINTARKIGKLDARLFIIPGNFELPTVLNTACKENGWTDLHGKQFRIDDITIGGCGGAPKGPFNTPYELEEDEFRSILAKIDYVDILVTHAPPKGVTDYTNGLHIGSEAIREFIEDKRPRLTLCGHVHENGGKEGMINNTKVMNIAREIKIIDI
ncbi:MAG: metallophosphoesterase [Candidatus Nitrosocaldaceae archaeon]|nr:MAG: metallophosphoesterase [Candidatus Nitrosocaldaceae archaeon]